MTHSGGKESLNLKIVCSDVADLRKFSSSLRRIAGRKTIRLRVVFPGKNKELVFETLNQFNEFIVKLFMTVSRDRTVVHIFCRLTGHEADLLANIASGYQVGIADE